MKHVFVTGGSGFVGTHLIAALREKNIIVSALIRSEKSEKIIRKLGAHPVRGDLLQKNILVQTMTGCEVVFHLAAVTIRAGGTDNDFYTVNVLGTENILSAAKKAGVKKIIFVSTEVVLLNHRPLINVDESWPIPDKPFGIYARTKALAEKKVLEANSPQFETIIIRPRLIWGKGSKGIETIINKAKEGKLVFINHGKNLTSTCHVMNVCEALLLAAEKGKGGEVYFVSDGKPIMLCTFVNRILKARNIPPVQKSIPHWLAWLIACVIEYLWTIFRLKGSPAFNRVTIKLLGEEVTVNDSKARKELGYVGKISMIRGFQEFKE